MSLCRIGDDRAADVIAERAVEVVENFLSGLIPSAEDRKTLKDVKQGYCRMLTRNLPLEKQAEALTERLDRMGDWVQEALVGLGEQAVPVLLKKFEDTTRTPAYRIQVVRCLSKMKSRKTGPLFKNLLSLPKNDPLVANSGLLIGEAAAALIAVSGSDGLEAVKLAFQRNKNWLTRLYIVRSLSVLADLEAKQWLLTIAEDESLTADTEATRRKEQRAKAVRDHAALSTSKIEVNFSEDRVGQLIDLLKHRHNWVRTYAIQTLSGTQDKRAFEPAVAALSELDGNVRRFAIETLSLLGDRRAIDPLKKVLTGENLGDQVPAKNALEALGLSVVYAQGAFHVADLKNSPIPKLLSQNQTEQKVAVNALLDKGSEVGIQISAALQSKNEHMRRAGLAGLAILSDRARSGLDEEAANAIEAIGKMGANGVPNLVELIRKVETAGRRKQIAEALGKSGSSAVPAITTALNAKKKNHPWIADLFHALSLCGRSGIYIMRQYEKQGPDHYRKLAKKALEGVKDKN